MFKSRTNFLQEKFKAARHASDHNAAALAAQSKSAAQSAENSKKQQQIHAERADVIAQQASNQLSDDFDRWNSEFESWGKQWQAEIREFNFENVKLAALAAHKDRKEAKLYAERSNSGRNTVYAFDAVSSRSKSSLVSITMPEVLDYSQLLDDPFAPDDARTASDSDKRPHMGKGQHARQLKTLSHNSTSPFRTKTTSTAKLAAEPHAMSSLLSHMSPFKRATTHSPVSPIPSDASESDSDSVIAAYYALEAVSPESIFDEDLDLPKDAAPHAYSQLSS